MSIVEESWNEPMRGNPMGLLHQKLKRLKLCLKQFNRVHFSNISMRVKEKRVELAKVQEDILSNNSRVELVQIEKTLSKELYNLMRAEESFYKQKSRVQWIREGDSNTSFFHKTVAARQSRNSISYLISSEGNRISTFSDMAEEAVSFFQKLIGEKDDNVSGCPSEILSELVTSTISEEAQCDLIKPIKLTEIKSTLFAIGGEKTPGPDGYTAQFFKSTWHIVGGDVTKAILYFFFILAPLSLLSIPP